MEILVIGAGEMGRWFAAALDEDGPAEISISFLDVDAERAREAAESVNGEAVTPDTAAGVELVCIAVPIPAARAAIERYSRYASAAVLDVTGTMTDPLDAMAEHAPSCERASLHPLFAPENEPGNVPVVIDEGGPATEAVIDALEARGNDVFETTASQHDRAMETVQARTHAAVLAFGLCAESVPDRFQTPISAELSALTEQVTGGESRVYADIQSAFDGAADVASAAQRIADADREEFEQLYEAAKLEQSRPADEYGETAETNTERSRADRDDKTGSN